MAKRLFSKIIRTFKLQILHEDAIYDPSRNSKTLFEVELKLFMANQPRDKWEYTLASLEESVKPLKF